MTIFYQRGAEIVKPAYTGEDSVQVVYTGAHTVTAIGATLEGTTVTAADIIELPLVLVPAGAKVTRINWVWDRALTANAGTTAVLYARKASVALQAATNNTYSQSGKANPNQDINTLVGSVFNTNTGMKLTNAAVTGVAGVGAVPGATVLTPLALQSGSVNVLPIGVEGWDTTSAATIAATRRQTLSEDYLFGIYLTVGTTGAPLPAGANIFMSVEAEFVGNL
jgi:hypothetical protein